MVRLTLCDTRDFLSATVCPEFVSTAWKTRPCGGINEEQVEMYQSSSRMHQFRELGQGGRSGVGTWRRRRWAAATRERSFDQSSILRGKEDVGSGTSPLTSGFSHTQGYSHLQNDNSVLALFVLGANLEHILNPIT